MLDPEFSEEFKEELKKEYKKAVPRYKEQIKIILRFVSVLIAVNVAVIGLGLNYEKSSLFWVGAFISVNIFLVFRAGERTARFYLLSVVDIENILGYEHKSIISHWGLFSYEKHFQQIAALSEIQDVSERLTQLYKIKSAFSSRSFLVPICLVVILQVGFALGCV